MQSILSTPVHVLEKRFREAEITARTEPPIVVRMDGVGFSRLGKLGFETPRDRRVFDALVEAGRAIMSRYSFDAVQIVSDEINIYVLGNTLPYGGRIEKLVSIPASIASATASMRLGVKVFFDARIIKLLDPCEALNYAYYRARVGYGNYVNSLARRAGYSPPPRTKLPRLIDELRRRGLEPGADWKGLGGILLWEKHVRITEAPGRGPIAVERRRQVLREGLAGLESFSRIVSDKYECLGPGEHL